MSCWRTRGYVGVYVCVWVFRTLTDNVKCLGCAWFSGLKIYLRLGGCVSGDPGVPLGWETWNILHFITASIFTSFELHQGFLAALCWPLQCNDRNPQNTGSAAAEAPITLNPEPWQPDVNFFRMLSITITCLWLCKQFQQLFQCSTWTAISPFGTGTALMVQVHAVLSLHTN